ncbi:hypothetical protein SISNIDRAFT_461256 [Sistotremastrum niveocremeum HHB9708]|uniref:CBM1 domain-containing protein n=1 Tax=Sistotremastrum niveocremeum HHB9708 TaxID=1314777 RepID=A0A164MVJ3_9AGAM|nr:hypothetical protein SISNIDRAFT_461256 [Sistotremastrum niveocremeum HHB9708]
MLVASLGNVFVLLGILNHAEASSTTPPSSSSTCLTTSVITDTITSYSGCPTPSPYQVCSTTDYLLTKTKCPTPEVLSIGFTPTPTTVKTFCPHTVQTVYETECTSVTPTFTCTTSGSPVVTTTKITTTVPCPRCVSHLSSTSSDLSLIHYSTSTHAPTLTTQTPYGQCGGTDYYGPTLCPTLYRCSAVVPSYYSQCLNSSVTSTTTY